MHPYTITTLQPVYFAALEQLQRDCYPTLAEDELMLVEHFASQYEVFPSGQIVVLDGERVIGQGSGFLLDFDFGSPNHRFREICDNLYFRTHNPGGAFYYGADISVHPDYRGPRDRQADLSPAQGDRAQRQPPRDRGGRNAARFCAAQGAHGCGGLCGGGRGGTVV